MCPTYAIATRESIGSQCPQLLQKLSTMKGGDRVQKRAFWNEIQLKEPEMAQEVLLDLYGKGKIQGTTLAAFEAFVKATV